MQFDVSHHLQQPVGYKAQCELGQNILSLDDDANLSDFSGTMSLLRTDIGLLASVVATCTIHEACSRCLTDLDYDLHLDFQEEYLPTVDALTGLPVHAPKDIDNFLIDSSFILNLDEAIRQYWLTTEPSKPLCRPDCAGLCSRCGRNLNDRPCGCPEEPGSRWDALAHLANTLEDHERS